MTGKKGLNEFLQILGEEIDFRGILIEKQGKAPQKILEIGVGKGILLDDITKIIGSPTPKLFGFQHPDWQTNLCNRDIMIMMGDITNYQLPKNEFDLALSQHSFYFIGNKLKALENIYLSLREKGNAIIHLDTSFDRRNPEEMPHLKLLCGEHEVNAQDYFANFRRMLTLHLSRKMDRTHFIVHMRKKLAPLDFGLTYDKSLSGTGKTNTPIREGYLSVYQGVKA